MFLTAPQASVLSVLVFAGPQSVGDLAKREQVSSPAMTKHIDKLERRGLAERVRSQADRRIVEVHATTAGHALLHRGRAERVRVLADRLAGLSHSEHASIGEGLDALLRLL